MHTFIHYIINIFVEIFIVYNACDLQYARYTYRHISTPTTPSTHTHLGFGGLEIIRNSILPPKKILMTLFSHFNVSTLLSDPCMLKCAVCVIFIFLKPGTECLHASG